MYQTVDAWVVMVLVYLGFEVQTHTIFVDCCGDESHYDVHYAADQPFRVSWVDPTNAVSEFRSPGPYD